MRGDGRGHSTSNPNRRARGPLSSSSCFILPHLRAGGGEMAANTPLCSALGKLFSFQRTSLLCVGQMLHCAAGGRVLVGAAIHCPGFRGCDRAGLLQVGRQWGGRGRGAVEGGKSPGQPALPATRKPRGQEWAHRGLQQPAGFPPGTFLIRMDLAVRKARGRQR